MSVDEQTADAMAALQNEMDFVVGKLAQSKLTPAVHPRRSLAAELVSLIQARRYLEALEHKRGSG